MARHPCSEWRQELYHQADVAHMKPSAHLCGGMARAAMADQLGAYLPAFPRVQINGFALERAEMRAVPGHEYILQVRREEDLQATASFIAARPTMRASILFDPSGGRGLEPFRWPHAPLGVRMGFAGGITPDNELTVLGDIVASNGILPDGVWIDMESGIRDEADRFDLGKVRWVLEQIAATG